MRAVVTGAAGFLGLHLCQRLQEMGLDVLGIDDFSTHDHPVSPDGLDLIEMSVQRAWDTDVVDMDGVGVIFHLAGKVGPTGVIRWKGEIAKDTVDSSYIAGQWSKEAECPLIDISTSEVYGSPDEANSEDTPKVFMAGHSARQEYAVAKLAAEQELLNDDDIDVRIIRPFNVTGPGQRVDGGFVLPRFAMQALTGTQLTVYQPGSQRRAFTHVLDIVDGIIEVWTSGEKNDVYNLGNHRNVVSIIRLAQEVIDEVGDGEWGVVDPVDLHGPDFREAPEKIPDATKAMDVLGWYPVRDRQQIVEEVVDDMRERLAA